GVTGFRVQSSEFRVMGDGVTGFRVMGDGVTGFRVMGDGVMGRRGDGETGGLGETIDVSSEFIELV
ncbi:MAG: hypothetical protein SW833_14535, partial [Cyanobacteriota bacterium]|nr:hypothetical protein [Cyanobacteriota bacterium]